MSATTTASLPALTRVPTADESRWLTGLVWGWAILLVQADLKITLTPYIHWIATGAFLLLALPALARLHYSWGGPLRVASAGLVVATLLSAIGSQDPTYGMGQAAKLAVLLLGGGALFVGHPHLARTALRAFIGAVHLNAVALLAGFAGVDAIASEMGPGRWGTIFNYPGSLWRCGALILVYSLYLAFGAPAERWRCVPLLAESLLLIGADGSRTALLLMPLALGTVVWAKATEPGSSPRLRKALVAVTAAAAIGAAGVIGWAGRAAAGGETDGGLARVGLLFLYVSQYGLDGFSGADATRVAMVVDSLDAIAEHPILGSGIGTTTSGTDVGPMPVHMTYLQVWADLGLLGLVSILVLMLAPIMLARRVLKRVRKLPAPVERALQYNAAFLVALYAFSALMHPLSTEWSEWLLYLVPLGILVEQDGKAPFGQAGWTGTSDG